MTVDIVILTYWKDAGWLEYCLRSIQKYATGFRQTIVVYPPRDRDTVKPVCDRFPFVKIHEEPEPDDRGHEFQNMFKCFADTLSDAEYFLHTDSDCVFIAPTTPEDYFTDGRPDLLHAPYESLLDAHANQAVPWRRITARALGVDIQVETMRRFPFVYRRDTYSKLRARVEEVNHMDFKKYALYSQPIPPAWRPFSDFNALGGYAFTFQRDQYYLYDTKNPLKPAKVVQAWSHSGLTEQEKAKLEEQFPCV